MNGKDVRKLYCGGCGHACGEIADGWLLGGARVLCSKCDGKRVALAKAVRAKASPEIMRKVLDA